MVMVCKKHVTCFPQLSYILVCLPLRYAKMTTSGQGFKITLLSILFLVRICFIHWIIIFPPHHHYTHFSSTMMAIIAFWHWSSVIITLICLIIRLSLTNFIKWVYSIHWLLFNLWELLLKVTF